jgi:hypothetical protein
VKERIRTEEQQKDLIFKIFSEWQDSTCSDRTQTYFLQLCEQIYKWYKDYHPQKVDDMGLEIADVIDNFMNKDKKLNIPKDKDGFYKYLNTALSNEKNASFREYNENDIIKIQKEKKQKLRKVKDSIRLKESQLGKKLTSSEREQIIYRFFKKQEYIDLLNSINVGSISYTNDDENNEIDLLNYVKTSSDDPLLVEYITRNNMEAFQEVVKSLLNKKQKRSRDCYKALFTLYCIKNDLRGLYPILDQEIIDSSHKDDKKLKQYEIYLKYHPETDKKGAEAMASTNLHEFLNDIVTCLYEIYLKNHPETDKKGAEAMAAKNPSDFLIDIATYLKEK